MADAATHPAHERTAVEEPEGVADAGERAGPAADAPSAALSTEDTEATVSAAAPPVDFNDYQWYLNRELTFLEFNRRVLHEGESRDNPLLERVKFLAIVASNLDEFFMKRIGGLMQQVGAGVRELSIDGRTPEQQIDECHLVVRDLEERQRHLARELHRALIAKDIHITGYRRLTPALREQARDEYIRNILPLITPLAVDPAHPFPFVSNLSLNLLLLVRYPRETNARFVRIKVPVGGGVPRFLKVGDGWTFVPLEQVIANNVDLLLPGMIVESSELFRVTRNAITEMPEEQANDLLVMIESELRDRKFAPIVRLEVSRGMNPTHRGMLAAELGLNQDADVFEVEGIMAKRDLWQIARIDRPDLHDAPHHPIDHPGLHKATNIFHAIRDHGPFLLQHPYESFVTSVERLVKEASEDPKVVAIKMTLYRTAEDSRIIDHLIDAAQNGKQVAVCVELKARFDESANIRWANRLEEAGIHVSYGVLGLKTHSKIVFVIRRDYDGLRRYAHIGTGNYHAGTARLYTDLGLLTCDPVIGEDLTQLFNYLTTGLVPKRSYHKLLPAPTVLKKALLDKIDREIQRHRDGQPGLIQFKMNALEDKAIVKALYRASSAGVKVDLIVRDTCRLRPGIADVSDSVRVVSIVGRFLEHSRIYYFQNDGDEEYFIGSADCMKRNLEARVEVVTPVEAPELRQQLRQIIDVQLAAQRNAWDMQPDGSYVLREGKGGESKPNSQELLIELARKRYRAAQRPDKKKNKMALAG